MDLPIIAWWFSIVFCRFTRGYTSIKSQNNIHQLQRFNPKHQHPSTSINPPCPLPSWSVPPPAIRHRTPSRSRWGWAFTAGDVWPGSHVPSFFRIYRKELYCLMCVIKNVFLRYSVIQKECMLFRSFISDCCYCYCYKKFRLHKTRWEKKTITKLFINSDYIMYLV